MIEDFGTSINVMSPKQTSIFNLKQKIELLKGIPLISQKMFYQGEELDNSF